MDSTFQLDAGSLCSTAAMVSAMLKDMIKWTFYTIISISIDDRVCSSPVTVTSASNEETKYVTSLLVCNCETESIFTLSHFQQSNVTAL
jgi:hypothetical protein